MAGWWHEVWLTVAREFSDLDDVKAITQGVMRLGLALLLGGALGFEREMAGRDARMACGVA